MTLPPSVHDADPIPEAARAAIDALLQSGDLFRYTSSGDAPVALLEAEFAALLGSKYALAVSSCSAALFLSLKALDLPRDARVLLPGFTFAAVPSSVVHAGCVPVLCEVGDDYRVDLADFEARLDGDIAAIIISHMRGHTSNVDVIMGLALARDIPVIEDAAHSLGTTWAGQNIGTIGHVEVLFFPVLQDDQCRRRRHPDHWTMPIWWPAPSSCRAPMNITGKKHPVLHSAFARWQNRLPLFNLRMSNLSAAVIRPQLPELAARVEGGRANHDHVAARLNASPFITVPDALPPEIRAPDSIQFNLEGMDDSEVLTFATEAEAHGVKVQVFGLSQDNARAFWNWQFMPQMPELPQTRAMLMRACDVRLPVRLTPTELDLIADILLAAADAATGPVPAYGT